ncbi:hypothetical protein ACFQEQ_00970 [Halolamina salina]|uniref:hypothetical protein n=1 Tax=Halolamina salina TaxID=1220023 RepID=UPI00360763F5
MIVSLLGLAVSGGAVAAPADATTSVTESIEDPTVESSTDEVTTNGCYQIGFGQVSYIRCP